MHSIQINIKIMYVYMIQTVIQLAFLCNKSITD
jgi:hypothetical protein